MDCPSCREPVPADARFCPSCGSSLEVRVDQRRVVTVVFADLVGFTGLSEARDPEHVKNLVDRAFERLAADVTAYGGKVDKIVGDALVALFGAPVAHEDDAERAVRAALQMQRTVDAYAGDAGLDVRMRVGVNTGEVLVGALRAGDDYTAMGDVVNVASRLQAAAEPGQVLVGPSSHDATDAVIRYRPVGSLEVRGRGEAVDAWVALEAIAPPGYRPRRIRTPLLGREAEIGLLRHALDAAARRARPHVILLSGEAGMGKSRMGEELASIAMREHDAAVFVGRCVPYGEANPWWPVSEVLRQAFGVELRDGSEASQAKIREGVERATGTEGGEAERLTDALLFLMGLDNPLADVDPSRATEEAIGALTAVVEGLASRRLVVLFLADLHWADEQVLDLVDRFLERLRPLPVVIVGTARPELEDRWSPEPRRHNAIWLHLDPLEATAIDELVTTLAGEELPDRLREELRSRSGGNPFFAEELVALLSEAGMLDEGVAVAPRSLGDLPSSLRGLVAARLDGIGARERSMVEDAAVIGRVGPVTALVDLSAARGEAHVAPVLDGLVGKDLLVLDDGGFEFKSDLVREVAYETLTKSARAQRHAAVAGWLVEQAGRTGREDELLEQIAHHWGAAAELAGQVGAVEGVPDDVRERALEWLERAALRARERDASLAAEQLFDAAIGLLGDADDAVRQRLLLGRAEARVGRHDLPGARADVTEVLADAEAVGDDARRVRALIIRGEVEQREGDADAALETLDDAMRLADRLGDQKARADALRQWGMAQLFRGAPDEAELAIAEARDAFRELGDRRAQAWALQNLAWIAFIRGDSAHADERLSEAAAMFEELSDWGGRGWALGLLGFVRLTQGRLEEAGELAETVIEDARRGGDRWGLGMTLVLRSSVALWSGRTSLAHEAAREARRVFEAIGDLYGISLAVANQTRAEADLGRMAEARSSLEEAVTLFHHQGSAMRFMGENLTANLLGHVGDARGAYGAVAGVDVEASDAPTELLVGRSLALLQLGRAEEALPLLDRVLHGEQTAGPGDAGVRNFAWSVRALADAAVRDPDAALASAEAVRESGRGTYLDETYADLGASLALVQRGDGAAARAALERARRRVEQTEDRLTHALVGLARARVLGALGDDEAERALKQARERCASLGLDPYGWETVLEAATSGSAGALGDRR